MNSKKWVTKCKVSIIFSLFFSSFLYSEVIYVNSSANGDNDGTSWVNAYTDLQSALSNADPNSKNEIWVATGIYYPTYNYGLWGKRGNHFRLINGVALYGGFVGSEINREQRSNNPNLTILSGDLNKNGRCDPNDVYHVFFHTYGLNNTAILNGFKITCGYADAEYSSGGGMYNNTSSPTIINCIFYDNFALWSGGGMQNIDSNPKILNCLFESNGVTIQDESMGGGSGGGICNFNSNPEIINSLFRGNNGGANGGGICNYESSPTIKNCIFTSNTAVHSEGRGGGVFNRSSQPIISGCSFRANSSDIGGGMSSLSSPGPIVTNCIFNTNFSESFGGSGMDNDYCSPIITNCTFSNNVCGIYSNVSSPTITNCIIWGNDTQIYSHSGSPIVTYSDIEGGYSGTGNINENPLFVLSDPNGNVSLQEGSPCIDAGSNTAIPVGVTTDLDGERRIVDGNRDNNAVVDMGAYEYYRPGELDTICGVNMYDFNQFSQSWLKTGCQKPDNCNQADIDRNGTVELNDLVILAAHWLEGV